MNAFLTRLEQLRLNTKLMLGFDSGLLIAAAIGFLSLTIISLLEIQN